MKAAIRKKINIILLALMLLALACRPGSDHAEQQAASEQNVPDLPATTVPAVVTPVPVLPTDTPTPVTTPTAASTPTETPVPTALPTPTATPVPTEAPTPTVTPTATPEPNPYVGIWTIGELPFSLELRNDGTYLASVIGEDKEGQYAYDAHTVTLYPSEDATLELQYYTKADTLKLGEFKLIRDDLIFFQETDFIPVSYETENDDISVSVRNAVVEVRMKRDKTVQQYCFTKEGLAPQAESKDWFNASDDGEAVQEIRVFKYDGKYTLWARDPEGNVYEPINIEVVSGYIYPVSEDELEIPNDPLKALLKEEGVTIDRINRSIAKDVAAAGYYTRTGVVTAGVALISDLAQYGYCVGYQGHGSYHAEKNWGVNGRWGELLDTPGSNGKPYYMGMSETASIIWAYKQAGINLASELDTKIGALGEHERSKDNKIDYDRAKTGDIVKLDSHYMMVIDRLDQDADGADDAYLIYQISDGHLTVGILPFRQAQKREFYSMDAVFDNSGRNSKKALYWKSTFRIPTESLPQYILESVETETLDRNYHALLRQLGFGA